ncbi:hypothetical protein PInf_013162 [Phytophthora infestans]|nr:hypothetical protein PInf_013162 [Phytophthora infestans]
MLHDLWTNASNMNIIGVTVVFVDSEWRLVKLSLLAMPNTHGHAAGTVADLIKARMQDRYNIDVDRVLNHYAFAQYFEGALDSETAVWSSISKDDWTLITEMEGLTNQLAQFSLGEVQKQGVASSQAADEECKGEEPLPSGFLKAALISLTLHWVPY